MDLRQRIEALYRQGGIDALCPERVLRLTPDQVDGLRRSNCSDEHGRQLRDDIMLLDSLPLLVDNLHHGRQQQIAQLKQQRDQEAYNLGHVRQQLVGYARLRHSREAEMRILSELSAVRGQIDLGFGGRLDQDLSAAAEIEERTRRHLLGLLRHINDLDQQLTSLERNQGHVTLELLMDGVGQLLTVRRQRPVRSMNLVSDDGLAVIEIYLAPVVIHSRYSGRNHLIGETGFRFPLHASAAHQLRVISRQPVRNLPHPSASHDGASCFSGAASELHRALGSRDLATVATLLIGWNSQCVDYRQQTLNYWPTSELDIGYQLELELEAGPDGPRLLRSETTAALE